MLGQCLCETVSFEILTDIPQLYQCHCSLCRKQSGAASNCGTFVATADFCWRSGQDNVNNWRKDSGFSSSFCKTCGSPVPNILGDTELMFIPVGVLADVKRSVVAHLYCDSKASWDVIADSDAVFHAQLPDLMELQKALESGDK